METEGNLRGTGAHLFSVLNSLNWGIHCLMSFDFRVTTSVIFHFVVALLFKQQYFPVHSGIQRAEQIRDLNYISEDVTLIHFYFQNKKK